MRNEKGVAAPFVKSNSSQVPSENGSRKRTGQFDKEWEEIRGLSSSDFRKIAPNGFGDPYNAYPHSMTWLQDYLYVGTTRACLAYRGKRFEDDPEAMGEIWPVKIPEDRFDIDLRAEIWRYYPPTEKWTRVFISPMVKGIEGFKVPLVVGFRAMISFQGLSDPSPALYVPTFGSQETPEAVMLRSIDGVNFEMSEPGMGFPDPYKPRGIRALITFKGRLFTSPAVGSKGKESNIAGFMVIAVNNDPKRKKWQLACEPNFGDPNNLTVFDMAEFQGYLYAGTLNINEGFQVWKTDGEGKPPHKWKKIITRGAYRGKFNQIAITLCPFGDHLYVGSALQGGGYDYENKIGPASPEIIRINPDDSWDLVVGESRFTPEGLKVPFSGLGPGFGNPFAGYLWSMCVHEGWLYAGTLDWVTSVRYRKRDRWPEHLRKSLTDEKIEQIIHKFGGCELWRTLDGYRWTPVIRNGFGNQFNLGIRTMASTPHGLFVGVANPFAPEVAIKRASGWKYENNPKGGLEIWLGSHSPGPARISCSSKETPVCLTGIHLMTKDAKESDEDYLEEIIGQFYGGSDFRHFGYWRGGINDAKTACENLMDEILAFIPEKKGTIIDIGCGLGATTQYLLKYFPPEAVTGITTDKRELGACRKKVPHVKFLYRKLPKLKLPEESFDFVIWVKGFSQLGERRQLLRESFRILKPGGRLVCFDILRVRTIKNRIRHSILTFEGPVEKLAEYRDLLPMAGFKEFNLLDVTTQCLGGFRKHMEKYFGLKRLSGEIDSDTWQKIEARLLRPKTPIYQCLLISAGKSATAHGLSQDTTTVSRNSENTLEDRRRQTR